MAFSVLVVVPRRFQFPMLPSLIQFRNLGGMFVVFFLSLVLLGSFFLCFPCCRLIFHLVVGPDIIFKETVVYNPMGEEQRRFV